MGERYEVLIFCSDVSSHSPCNYVNDSDGVDCTGRTGDDSMGYELSNNTYEQVSSYHC